MGYLTGRKQAVLRKLLPPCNPTVADLAKEEGVLTAAISQWRKAAQARGQLLPENSTESEGWSMQDKFNAVLETAVLAEAELAEYCNCPNKRCVIAYECVHTSQFERLGGIHASSRQCLIECFTQAYVDSTLEAEAMWETKELLQ